MAAIGCAVEEGGEMCEEGATLEPPDDPVLADPPWMGAGHGLTKGHISFCRHRKHSDPGRRTARSGSTESVVTTSGADSSCSGSEPGSPARPVTPHSSMGGPAFECLRADSEDSGLGPSPAKSSPTSPEGPPCSPIRFDDRCSDSLLDLSPRTEEEEEDNTSEPEDMKCGSVPNDDNESSGFQFLLAASQSDNSNKDCEDEDFSRMRFSNCEEEEEEDTSSSSSSTAPGGAGVVSSSNYSDRLLNPKVVLIRSDFGGCYSTAAEDSTCSQQSSSAAASEDSCRGAGGSEGGLSEAESGACKWLNCERPADANATATDLLDHIRECHVRSQPEDAESFVCLWTGCKVYARSSCSRSWLERHILLHGGSKPFRCIVAGCRQRFGTEAALQRHVNSHFPHRHPSSHHQAGQPGHRLGRNRKNKKQRRRPQSNKSKDFFDDATMEYVRHNLFRLSSIEGVVTSGPPAAITFRSIVKGKRKTETGRVSYLLSWSPENIVPDAWVSQEDLVSEKTIPVSLLPSSSSAAETLLPAMDALGLSTSRKRKRK